jgi:hypothetical protein
MSSSITKESSSCEVVAWLKEKGLNEAASEIQSKELELFVYILVDFLSVRTVTCRSFCGL